MIRPSIKPQQKGAPGDASNIRRHAAVVGELQGKIKERPNRPERSKGGGAWPRDVARAAAFIHEHLYEAKLTVARMRRQCRINGKSFASRFRLYVGRAPKKYIIAHRIEAARRLLADPELQDIPVTQIALAVGFNSYTAFARNFKNKEEVSPSVWRDLNCER